MRLSIIKSSKVIMLCLPVVLCACSSPSVSTQPNSPSVADVQLRETSSRAVVSIDTIRINNCGNKAANVRTTERSLNIIVDGSVGASVGYAIVQANISAKYGLSKSVSEKMDLTANPGTNMEFVLKWTEQEWIGTVLSGGQTGTYNVHSPISVEQVSANDLGCGVSQPTQSSLVPVQTSSTQSTVVSSQPSSLPASLCVGSVSRAEVDTWSKIGATDKTTAQRYITDYYGAKMQRDVGYKSGDTVPAGVFIATDFGNGDSDVYSTYPVKPVVHYRSWGIFETTKSFVSPSTGSCLTIR